MEDRPKKAFRKALEKIKIVLKYEGLKYTQLTYPSKYRERSIDIVAVTSKENILVRVKPKPNIDKEEAGDLLKASKALNALPIVISPSSQIRDDVIYEKEGVFVMNERTFENIISGSDELIALYRRGEYLFKINREELRRLRERGYSLGDIAYAGGVSRRSAYKYATEGGLVTINVALRLAEAFGESVVEGIRLKTLREIFAERSRDVRSDEVPEEVYAAVSRSRELIDTLMVYRIKKSAPDYLTVALDESESERIAVVDATNLRKVAFRDAVKKAEETLKMAEVVPIKEVNLVVKSELKEKFADELSIVDPRKEKIMRIIEK